MWIFSYLIIDYDVANEQRNFKIELNELNEELVTKNETLIKIGFINDMKCIGEKNL